MGLGDNRRTPKMRRRKRQAKLKHRLKRRISELREERGKKTSKPSKRK